MGIQNVPAELMQSEMPDPMTGEPASTPETPSGSQPPAAPANAAPAAPAGNQPPATPENGAPAGAQAPAGTQAPEGAAPELIELPDGRKVDIATATREVKEHFLPEYTRVTQKLAALEHPTLPTPGQTPEPDKPKRPWEDPDWVPSSTQELLDAAVQKFQDEQQAKADAEQALLNQVRTEVATAIDAIKQKDSNLNEEELFKHANKYKFTDITTAYENMMEMKQQRKAAMDEAAKARAERADEPVSGSPSAPAAPSDGVDYDTLSQGGSMVEAAQEHLARLKGN